MKDSDVMIVATTPAPNCQALMEIPVSQLVKDTKPMETALSNIFKVTPREQAETVSTIQCMMDMEGKGRHPSMITESTAPTPVPVPTATTTSRDALAMRLKLSAKELKHLHEMVATNVGMEHLIQTTTHEGIHLPASQSLSPAKEPFGEAAAV